MQNLELFWQCSSLAKVNETEQQTLSTNLANRDIVIMKVAKNC